MGNKPAEKLPMPPVERRALVSLLVGVAATAAAIRLVMAIGPELILSDSNLRLLATRLALAGWLGPACLDILGRSVWRQSGGRVVIDERDVRILERAPSTRVRALIVCRVMGGSVECVLPGCGLGPVFFLALSSGPVG